MSEAAGLLAAPLLLARYAIAVTIHLDARALPQEELGLGARGHLGAVDAPIAFERFSPRGRPGGAGRVRRGLSHRGWRHGLCRRGVAPVTLLFLLRGVQLFDRRRRPDLAGGARTALVGDRAVDDALEHRRCRVERQRGRKEGEHEGQGAGFSH